jgi:hypothetical protein
MAEKQLTPEEMSFLADKKILHGFGKVPSTEGKSSLDAVNFGTLATNPRVRSGDTSSHENASTQRAVACAVRT